MTYLLRRHTPVLILPHKCQTQDSPMDIRPGINRMSVAIGIHSGWNSGVGLACRGSRDCAAPHRKAPYRQAI